MVDTGLAKRGLELNPNDADVLAESAWPLAYVGRAEEGIENARTAMRLNPRHPDWYFWALGVAYYDARRYEEAVATLESRKQPNLKSNLYLATAYAQLGRQEQAQATVQKILAKNFAFKGCSAECPRQRIPCRVRTAVVTRADGATPSVRS